MLIVASFKPETFESIDADSGAGQDGSDVAGLMQLKLAEDVEETGKTINMLYCVVDE